MIEPTNNGAGNLKIKSDGTSYAGSLGIGRGVTLDTCGPLATKDYVVTGLGGDSNITVNPGGAIFRVQSDEDSVEFSFEELKKLKALLA